MLYIPSTHVILYSPVIGYADFAYLYLLLIFLFMLSLLTWSTQLNILLVLLSLELIYLSIFLLLGFASFLQDDLSGLIVVIYCLGFAAVDAIIGILLFVSNISFNKFTFTI